MSADEQSSQEQPAEVTVSVDEDHLVNMDEIAERLQALGLSVEELLAEIGVITGRIEESRAGDLEAVEGVARVERSRGYQLPPPESDIQ